MTKKIHLLTYILEESLLLFTACEHHELVLNGYIHGIKQSTPVL